jgi:RNA polymerase sigma-70 factor (ECF subfamily)
MRSAEDVQDELLVMQCQDGDSDSLLALVNRWQPRLLRHAIRLTRKQEAAMDIVQEAWVAIVRGIRRLDDPACFAPWAYRIVTNKCADWIRQQRRHRACFTSLAVEPAATEASTENMQDEVAAIRKGIGRLPCEQQAILSLFYVEELSIRNIAEALSLPIGTVKSRLHYARNNLKEVIEGRSHEGH